MVVRLLLSLSLLVVSLAAGRFLHRQGVLTQARAYRLVRWIIIGPSPLVLCLSLWQVNLRSSQPWLLPVIGGLISCSTLLPARWYAQRAGLTRPQQGSFLTCALFSNVGYIGALTAFALFGEYGYALCMLYLLFFNPVYYTLGFRLAARYGHAREAGQGGEPLRDELRLFPFIGLFAGAVLSLLGVPRPLLLERLNHVLIPLDTALYLIAVGSQLAFASPRPWLRACWTMSAIKFLYAPAVAWGLVTLLGLRGLPRTIILWEASMPVAVSPLVLPLLFGLDRPLSNALWLVTTLLAVPWLILILPLLQRL
ncbi:MAG: AEC family transporter [Candidatus Omnitrophica bacterium]|nr:AEC family transporter [Candidatus Omnitrophota bacterium]